MLRNNIKFRNSDKCRPATKALRKSEKWQLALALLEIMCAKKLADTSLACNSAASRALTCFCFCVLKYVVNVRHSARHHLKGKKVVWSVRQ